MRRVIVPVLFIAFALCTIAGCGEKKEETSSSSGIVTELTFKEKNNVIASLMGAIRNFEPDLETPEDPREYTVIKVDGHYSLVVTAKRPDGSNAMISYWVDLDGDKYSVHYFSVKNDIYVDDKIIDEVFSE